MSNESKIKFEIDEENITKQIIERVENDLLGFVVDDIRFICETVCPDDKAYVWVSPKTYTAIVRKYNQKPIGTKDDK